MTSEIRRIRPSELTREAIPTPGMKREAAIAREGLWSGIATTAPGMTSGWHHHGEHDTVIYVLDGAVRLEYGPAGGRTVEARTGDFLHVPARAVHRESNPLEAESRLLVTRTGSGALVVNVEGPDS